MRMDLIIPARLLDTIVFVVAVVAAAAAAAVAVGSSFVSASQPSPLELARRETINHDDQHLEVVGSKAHKNAPKSGRCCMNQRQLVA